MFSHFTTYTVHGNTDQKFKEQEHFLVLFFIFHWRTATDGTNSLINDFRFFEDKLQFQKNKAHSPYFNS